MESWRKVKDYPRYEVSDRGRVKNSRTGRILKQGNHRQGYSLVWLCDSEGRHGMSVHRLVAEAFVGNPESKPQVNHIDGNKSNNFAENLEWVTGRENTLHAYRKLHAPHSVVGVRITETGATFKSIKDCAKAIDGDSSSICGYLHGRRSTHKGFHFESVSQEDN